MMTFLIRFFFLYVFFQFLTKRLLNYLRYFQQEQYIQLEFTKWIFKNKTFDKRGSLLLVASSPLLLNQERIPLNFILFLIVGFLFLIVLEVNPFKVGKIKLNLTERALRIERVALIIIGLMLVGLIFVFDPYKYFFCLLAILQVLPFVLILSNIILAPQEKRVQKFFFKSAKNKFHKIHPYTLGITGSFGKTSTKHIVAELMNAALGPTFFPQKGINSLMGITREIREKLHPLHRYAVIEMAAFKIGSIAKICKLTPPDAAIVTAVAGMHLARFGGNDQVYIAKSELPRALKHGNNLLIVNGDNPGARKMASEFKKEKTFIYGLDTSKGPLDYCAQELKIEEGGTQFNLVHDGQILRAHLPLWGKAQVSNALAAIAFVHQQGIALEKVVAALARVQNIENRLEVQKSGEITYLKDAYNSNPEGFATALEVLKVLPGQRKILMTPGMIELGAVQFEENKKIAMKAAEICDWVVFVGLTNKEAFKSANFQKIDFVSTREEAFHLLKKSELKGDTILIENDLPDLYNRNLAWSF